MHQNNSDDVSNLHVYNSNMNVSLNNSDIISNLTLSGIITSLNNSPIVTILGRNDTVTHLSNYDRVIQGAQTSEKNSWKIIQTKQMQQVKLGF